MTLANKIRFVLIETSHPGNIGAVARAMKTMGLSDLVLVSPKTFPHPYASARAAGAHELLNHARVYDNLADALGDCHLIFGTSARKRSESPGNYSPRQFVQQHLNNTACQHKIAILFGNERNGLDNTTLSHCHGQIMIPTNSDYSSINLGAAAQILAYEIYHASLDPQRTTDTPNALPATGNQISYFYKHLDQVLTQLDYSRRIEHERTLIRLRNLFNRAKPVKDEIDLLHGILASINFRIRRNPSVDS